jgi:hypothetical protein
MLFALFAVLILPVVVGAAEKGDAEKPAAEKKPPAKAVDAAKAAGLPVRVYKVNDLLLARDFPLLSEVVPPTRAGSVARYDLVQGAGQFGPLLGERSDGNGAAPLTMDAIDEIIRRTVDPGNWQDEGGIAAIERCGTWLIIAQTTENHKKIVDLLEQLRGAQVTIEAKWVVVEESQIGKIIPEAGPKRVLPIEVTDAALTDAKAKTLYRGQITCFDGQAVHLVSGRAQRLLVDLEAVLSEGVVGWDPKFESFLWGALLEVVAALSPDGKMATVSLHSMVSESKGKTTRVIAGGEARGNERDSTKTKKPPTEVDLPEFLIHTFRTTVRVPLDKQVIAGGMTSPMATDGKVIYLVIQVSSSQ